MAAQSIWSDVAYPVAQYLEWFHALLPEHWPLAEFVDGSDELLRRAVLRLDHAQALADAVYADVLGQAHHVADSEPRAVRVVVALAPGKAASGAIQFMIDTPRAWDNIRLTDQSGADLTYIALPVGGERDPLNGQTNARADARIDHLAATWRNARVCRARCLRGAPGEPAVGNI